MLSFEILCQMFFVDMLTKGHCTNKINRKIKTSVFILTHKEVLLNKPLSENKTKDQALRITFLKIIQINEIWIIMIVIVA